MLFSLIVGTLNRPQELEICLDSLRNQSLRDFEVIVIDQSSEDRTKAVVHLEKYAAMHIVYQKVPFKGLSKARNVGLSLAQGDYFALIDDDAAYAEDYFSNAAELVSKYSNCIFSGYMWNPIDKCTLKEYAIVQDESRLSIRQILRMAPSPALIFPAELIKKKIIFDEQLGVGSRYGAFEETDLILAALDAGYHVLYSKKMRVDHPTIVHTFEIENDTVLKKKENYLRGFGALLKKDRYHRKNNRLLVIALEKCIKISMKRTGLLGKEKSAEALAELRGMKSGYKEYQ